MFAYQSNLDEKEGTRTAAVRATLHLLDYDYFLLLDASVLRGWQVIYREVFSSSFQIR